MGLLSKVGGAVVGLAGAALVTTSAPLLAGGAILGTVIGDGMEDDAKKKAHREGHREGFKKGIKDMEAKAQQNQ